MDAAFLAGTELFRDLPRADLEELAGYFEVVEFGADEILIRQGDPGDFMYLILSGCIRVVAVGKNREETLLADLGPGQTAGELALWTGGPRTATICTAIPSRLAKLTREDFDRFGRNHPKAVRAIDRVISALLRRGQIASALRSSDLFGNLEPSALREIEAELEPTLVRSGDTLFSRGECGDALYIVVTGLLEVRGDRDGEPCILAQLGRGETVGEMAVLDDTERSATVVAIRDSHLAKLSRDGFARLLRKHPEAVLSLVSRKLAARLRSGIAPSPSMRSLASIAAVAVSSGVPLDRFCDSLADSLSAHGRTLCLSSARFDAYAGKPGLAESAENEAADSRVIELLGNLETEYRYVIYQADDSDSAWTARCLRQCDRILMVGDAGSDPRSGVGAAVVWRALDAPIRRRASLVLLHRNAGEEPSGTREWLSDRRIGRHYHIRLDSTADFGRLARYITGRAVGLVLGGGAARGFGHVGVIRAIREAGIPIDMVGGTSAGSFMAVACALEYDDERTLQANVGAWEASLSDVTLPVVSFLSGRNAARYGLNLLRDKQFEDLWLPCYCISANLSRARVQVHDRGSVVRSLMATSRIPALLPPILWDGDLLVDGGIINNVPVDVMRAYPECGVVIASDVSPACEPLENSEFGDWVSGWYAFMQLAKPAKRRQRYPNMFRVLLRTTELGGAAHKRQVVGAADLYLTPPMADFKMTAYKRAREMADIAYAYAVPTIREWLASCDCARLLVRPPEGA